MKIYILIPFFSDGITLNSSEVEIFESLEEAETHAHALGIYHYEIVEK